MKKIKADEKTRAEKMPDERAAILQMFDAYLRLKELGWKEAVYCPKDGSHFHAIEAGSTGIHDCSYEGKWPDGAWWIYDGDMWPSHPILFKPKTDTPNTKLRGDLPEDNDNGENQ